MPIFEFHCGKCENDWSELMTSHRSPAPECPRCGARRSRKLFSTFAARTKSRRPPVAPCGRTDIPAGGCGGTCGSGCGI